MSEKISNESFFDLCTTAGIDVIPPAPQPRVFSPAQRGVGITGSQKQEFACVIKRLEDEKGYYQGDIIHPVVGTIQGNPTIARLIRNVECRVSIDINGPPGLIYRKLPLRWGNTNSWIDSAEKSIYASVEQWGQITSDRLLEEYRFEPMANPPEIPNDFPSIKQLFTELLSEFVIDSVDHPVIMRLLGLDASPAGQEFEEEDDESAY
jgi:hypothetical protein